MTNSSWQVARTRTSDPGRVEALHYAAAPRQRHAKRLVYVYFAILGLAVAGPGGGPAWAEGRGSARPAQGPGSVPCLACQSFSMGPDQGAALPDQLAAQKGLARLAPGTSGAAWTGALAEIRRRGGLPGVHLTGVPEEADPVLDAG